MPDFWDDFRSDIMADFNPMKIKTVGSEYEDRQTFTDVLEEMKEWNVVFYLHGFAHFWFVQTYNILPPYYVKYVKMIDNCRRNLQESV